jgi:hypothetical protein
VLFEGFYMPLMHTPDDPPPPLCDEETARTTAAAPKTASFAVMSVAACVNIGFCLL